MDAGVWQQLNFMCEKENVHEESINLLIPTAKWKKIEKYFQIHT